MGELVHAWSPGYMEPLPSTPFSCEPKTPLKNKSIKKEKKVNDAGPDLENLYLNTK